MVDGAGKAFRQDRNLSRPLTQSVVGHESHSNDLAAPARLLAHHPKPAVEQALATVVAQADELVSRHGQLIGKAPTLSQARVVGTPRRVAAHENLIGVYHARGVQGVAPHHLGRAVAALPQRTAGTNHH
jgi:hypothetical protein